MKGALKNIFLITIPTLIVLVLLLEVVTRIAKPKVDLFKLTGRITAVNPMSSWARNDAYSTYTAIPQSEVDGKSVNEFGFMSTPEIEMQKKDKTKRIVFLGGSSTAGTGRNLKDIETWPWIATELLNKNSAQDFDFINAALGGYTTFESYGRLWSRLRFFKPDVVVLNHAWNEMYNFPRAKEPMSIRNKFNTHGQMKTKTIEPHWIDPYIRWSQFLTKVKVKLSYDMESNGEISYKEPKELADDYDASGMQFFKDNLVLIRNFCNDNGIKLFVCKQATLITESTSEEDRDRCKYHYHGFGHDPHIDAFNQIYGIIDTNIPPEDIIDLTSLSGVGENFYDHVHPTPLGAERMGAIVQESIINNYINFTEN